MSYKWNKGGKALKQAQKEKNIKIKPFDIIQSQWYNSSKDDRQVKVSDIMIFRNDISTIKAELDERVGQKILIKGTLGRNKSFEEETIIKDTYSNFFLVEDKKRDTNVSYKYTDILTKELEVSIYDGQNYSPLILPANN